MLTIRYLINGTVFFGSAYRAALGCGVAWFLGGFGPLGNLTSGTFHPIFICSQGLELEPSWSGSGSVSVSGSMGSAAVAGWAGWAGWVGEVKLSLSKLRNKLLRRR